MGSSSGVLPQETHAEETTSESPQRARLRRVFFFALNFVTCAALVALMVRVLSYGGFLALEWGMLAAFVLTLPWLSIGFWNAVIGLCLDVRYGEKAAAYVNPDLANVREDAPITSKTAIIMPLRNEDAADAISRFQSVQHGLARTPYADAFEFHVLSDSDRPEILEEEERQVAMWQRSAGSSRIAYRRRKTNTGFKAGNIAEFVHRCGEDYDFFLPLDADSVMGAEIILRMVRVMQASPKLGMLQSLVTGLPSGNFFTRAFQFGMRHGMRSFTLGSAWWQADCGPNWGHNVLIRTIPFRDNCMLPVLPGRSPLSGPILSHDQLEAALIRRAGYETRVIAEESDSHEINPPSVVDFIRRELRWCNGNLQYLRLLGLPGLKPTSRIQLVLAILMYTSAPAWLAFIILGAALTVVGGQYEAVPIELGLGIFAIVMTMNLAPKMMGLAQVLLRDDRSEAYGGRDRVLFGGFAEIVFGVLIAPIVAVAITVFVCGLFVGRRVGWDTQQRDRERLRWREAAASLWPQGLFGAGLGLWLYVTSPGAIPFAIPILVPLLLAIPIAVLSTHPAGGRWSRAIGLFDVPEDRLPTFATTDALPAPDPA
ncbi:MAG: glucans biosynthesis glucosyltransferase MdoH [Pseudomonadota bacterium]